MTGYLRLFALEIPVVSLVSAHLSTLAGRRAFGRLALVTGVYGLGRMVLVLLLVGWGLSLTGAILANLGALLVQLAIARLFVRPTLRGRGVTAIRGVATYASALFLYTIGRHLFIRIDLMLVKATAGAAAAGFYGAAQALTRPLGLFVASFTPPFLATLARMFHDGRTELAGSMIGQAMRLVLCFLPFIALLAGSATEIVDLVYGPAYSATAPLLTLLLFASVGRVMTSVIANVLTAVGRPGLAVALTWPLLPVTVGVCLVALPRFGPSGAAAAVTGLSWLRAIAMVLSVHRHVGVYPGPATVLRVSGTALVAYALSSVWQSSGAWVILELSVIAAVVFVCLLLLGELTTQDLSFAISVVRREPE
jgi:O-antigen/teichoic acid export membrane protein